MINIYLLDKDFEMLGAPLSDFISLQWTARYAEAGDFTLLCLTRDAALVRDAVYITVSDDDNIGLIERVSYERNADGERIDVSGRMLLGAYRRDLIATSTVFADNAETLILQLTQQYGSLGGVTFGTAHGYGGAVTREVEYDNLYETITDVARGEGLTPRLRYDFDNNAVRFEVGQGRDLTEGQSVHNPVIFSDYFANIHSMSYVRSSQQYYNYAYIVGRDTVDNLVVATVDAVPSGVPRRAVKVNIARQIRAVDNATYHNAMLQKGRETLCKHAYIDAIDGKLIPTHGMTYRVDFEVGDICTVRVPYMDTALDLRITEVTRVYENGGEQTYVTVGKREPTLSEIVENLGG